MTEENKLCWFCKYFWYSRAEDDWSEVTPGSDFALSCSKLHWWFDSHKTTQEEFGRILTTARTCPDFILKIARGRV
jgi:hypothetical protein